MPTTIDTMDFDPAEGKRTVSSFAALWKSDPLILLKKSAQSTIETTWRAHLRPHWAHRQVASIRGTEVAAWLGGLTGGEEDAGRKSLAAQTARRCSFVLSQILELAVANKAIPKNPVRGVKVPAKASKPKPHLAHRQVERPSEKSSMPDFIHFLA